MDPATCVYIEASDRVVAAASAPADGATPFTGEPFVRVSLDAGRLVMSGCSSFGAIAGPAGGWQWDGSTLIARAGDSSAGLLFLHVRPDGVTLSPSIHAMARVDRLRVDVLSWSTYQYLGYYLGEDTPFADVFALRPGAHVRFTRAGLTRSAARPAYDRESLSLPAAVERFACLFSRATTRMADAGGVAARHVELSGGLDSRHILAELLRLGVDVAACVTSHKYPPDHDDETRIALRVARRAGVRWCYQPPPPDRASAEVDAAVRQGLCSDGGAWWLFREGVHDAPGHPAKHVPERSPEGATAPFAWFNGVGGDMLAGRVPGPNWMRTREHPTPVRDVVDAHLRRGELDAVARLFLTRSRRGRFLVPAMARRFGLTVASMDDMAARVAEELALHIDAGDPLASFLLWNGVRRKNVPAATRLVRDGDDVCMPFLDPAIVRFLLSLGPRLRYPDFHASLMARYGWTDIPVMGEGARPPMAARQRSMITNVRHFLTYRAGVRHLEGAVDRSAGSLTGSLVEDLLAMRSPRLIGALLTNALQWTQIQQWVHRSDYREHRVPLA